MVRPEKILLVKHITYAQLLEHIRTEKNARILKRLYFIKYRYEGNSISGSAKMLGVASIVGRRWQKRWNEAGYEGLKPRFKGGRPAKISQQMKEQLIQILKTRNGWTTKQIRQLIINEFGVEYSLSQIHRILRKLGMKLAKPYQNDYRKPEDADEILKKHS